MKENLTVEQHWKLMAYTARQTTAQAQFIAAQEAAGNAHTQLLMAQQTKDTAQKIALQAKAEFSKVFREIGEEIGAEGDPDTWKVHIEENPADSVIEWEAEEKGPT